MSPNRTIARAGDWIEVHGHVQGEPARRALVLEVLGTAGSEHYRVRWGDDEHESIFYPGPDATVKPADKPAKKAAKKPAAKKAGRATK